MAPASHERQSDRGQTQYNWQHYIPLAQRKPGALRNGAPFVEVPEPLQQLRRALLRGPGGDRVMVQVLAIVPTAGLDAVLVAVELALEGTRRGRVSVEQGGRAALESSLWLLEHLLQAETTGRAMRSVNHQMHAAKFPVHRDLAGFDFEGSQVDRKLIHTLAELAFTEAAHTVVLVGGPGTGKTHLATAIGVSGITRHGASGCSSTWSKFGWRGHRTSQSSPGLRRHQ